jgi:hypothetical protein
MSYEYTTLSNLQNRKATKQTFNQSSANPAKNPASHRTISNQATGQPFIQLAYRSVSQPVTIQVNKSIISQPAIHPVS